MSIPIECERRFLVVSDGWRPHVRRMQAIRQGYLAAGDAATVRVRRIGALGFLAVKTPHEGISRNELEYEIPAEHANFLIDTACGHRTVEKTRHDVMIGAALWTVDVFHGLNDGLILAEIELDAPDRPLALPHWIGPEVTLAEQFSNSSLSRHPFARWRKRKVA
jgi:adenylate cyclase